MIRWAIIFSLLLVFGALRLLDRDRSHRANIAAPISIRPGSGSTCENKSASSVLSPP